MSPGWHSSTVQIRFSVLKRMPAKQRGAMGSLTVGVGADGCRAGPLPDRLLLTTYLRTEAGGDYFALARDVDLRETMGEALEA